MIERVILLAHRNFKHTVVYSESLLPNN
eukprot:SAG31_NODE_6596_length_1957_cov_1.726588_1_plen_27_part_10